MRRRGFALLEAAVALAIVGTVSIGALAAFAAEARAARRGSEQAIAVSVASTVMARLQGASAPLLARLPDSLARGVQDVEGASYAWRASSARVPDEAGLFELRVAVQWPTGEYRLASRSWRAGVTP